MSTWNQSTALWFQEQERTVRRDFWAKLKHFAGQVPFVEDVVAAYYCALDPATPMRVRGILLAALVYFIFRLRARPLTWLSRLPALGFTDDAAVLTAGPQTARPSRQAVAGGGRRAVGGGSGCSGREGQSRRSGLSPSAALASAR
jgi:uncharacterized membrane protein YkvA (DUF1232 family)